MCFNIINLKDAICCWKQDLLEHYLSLIVDDRTLPLTRNFPYNHEGATNSTLMRTICEVQHITVSAFYFTVRKCSTARYHLALSVNEVYIKLNFWIIVRLTTATVQVFFLD